MGTHFFPATPHLPLQSCFLSHPPGPYVPRAPGEPRGFLAGGLQSLAQSAVETFECTFSLGTITFPTNICFILGSVLTCSTDHDVCKGTLAIADAQLALSSPSLAGAGAAADNGPAAGLAAGNPRVSRAFPGFTGISRDFRAFLSLIYTIHTYVGALHPCFDPGWSGLGKQAFAQSSSAGGGNRV